MATATPPLQVERRPRARRLLAGLAVLGLVVLALWYARTPPSLPVSDREVTAATPVGQPVYVGVFAPGRDFDRTLHLSGVKVHATSNTEVEVTPLLCREGAIGVTSSPEAFCAELENPESQPFGAGDTIVLMISGEDPGIAVLDRVRLGFRDGLRWDTLEAGSTAVVRVLAREE